MRFIPIMSLLFSCSIQFGFKAHFQIGNCVQQLLSVEEVNKIYENNYLPSNVSFGEGSVWADKIKNQKQYIWTKKLHYYNSGEHDNPPEICGIVKLNGNDSLLGAIKYFFDKIEAKELLNSFEFRLLLHFFQDAFQSLHWTGKLRGGNGEIVWIKKARFSLHSLWDSRLFDMIYGKNTTQEITGDLIKKLGKVQCLEEYTFDAFLEIAQAISDLNCKIWARGLLTNEYLEKSKVVFQQLLLGSIRYEYCLIKHILQ